MSDMLNLSIQTNNAEVACKVTDFTECDYKEQRFFSQGISRGDWKSFHTISDVLDELTARGTVTDNNLNIIEFGTVLLESRIKSEEHSEGTFWLWGDEMNNVMFVARMV